MAHATNSSSARFRLSVEVDPSLHRLLRLAATARDQTIGQYVLDAIRERLIQDNNGEDGTTVVMAAADPVLAEIWDNAKDAEYDRL